MPHSDRGFENLRARPKAKASHGLPNAIDNVGRCVVSIGGRSAGGIILGRGQQFAEFCGRVLPFWGRVGTEGIRHCTPAGVFHEEGFFPVGRATAFGLDALECTDCFYIVESLVAEAAFANPVCLCYSEIAGLDGVWLGVSLPDDGRFGRSSLGRNAHSCVATSQAAW